MLVYYLLVVAIAFGSRLIQSRCLGSLPMAHKKWFVFAAVICRQFVVEHIAHSHTQHVFQFDIDLLEFIDEMLYNWQQQGTNSSSMSRLREKHR